MKIVKFLSKLGTSQLLKQLNPRTNELLKHFNILEKATTKKIVSLFISSIGYEKILKTKEIRNSLIDTLNSSEVKTLSDNIKKGEKTNYYKYLKNLKFSKNSKEYLAIKKFFEIETKVEIKDEKEVENLTISLKKDNESELKSLYPLFKHQIKASQECINILKGKTPRVFLHMPTGSGKTRTAINVMCSLIREKTEKFVIVWLANKEELCDQAFEEFFKAWQILGNQKIKVFKHFGGVRSNLEKISEYSEKNSAVIFSSLDMMYEDLTNNISSIIKLSHNVGLVVMDEAHLTIAKTYQNIIEILAPTQSTGILGLSATPGRSYRNVEEDIKLKDFYYGQKVNLKIKGEKNIIEWLIKEKYLAKVEIKKINFEADLAKLFNQKEIENEMLRIKEGKDYSKTFRDKISNDNERIELILDLIKEQSSNEEKILVFASSKNNAIAIADLLNMDGYNCASITSDTDPTLRREIIQDFKKLNSKINILINYDVLTTGFDAPKTRIAIITRPTTSIVLYHQMIGRVVRGEKQGGNKTCKVLTVVDTYLPGYRDLADSFYFWEDIWNDNE
jgi:superfamily II DNA or RNA helicase